LPIPMRKYLYFYLALILLFPAATEALAQKKSKQRDFGSSLRKLKWDPEQSQTTDTTASQAPEPDDDVIRVNTALVATDLLVLNSHSQPVRGLVATDFLITDEGKPQQVGHFLLGSNTSVPRSIALIIDYSGSQFPYIQNSVEAAKVLIDK